MKFSHLLMTTSLCAAVATTASAQGRPFSDVDANRNGALSLGELVSVFGQSSAERIVARADRNSDGELSKFEIRASFTDDENDDEEDSDESNDEEDDDESDEENDASESDESDESDDGESDEGDESDDGESDEGGESDDGESDEGGESDDGESDEGSESDDD